MKNRRLLWPVASAAASLALLVGGCSDTPVMPEVEPEVQLSVVSGDGQTGVCFAELSEPLVVQATKPQPSRPSRPSGRRMGVTTALPADIQAAINRGEGGTHHERSGPRSDPTDRLQSRRGSITVHLEDLVEALRPPRCLDDS